jgi:hypothetical protein
MAEDKFPLPGSSYKELSKIVAAYSTFSAPVSPADVAKTSVTHADQVSRSNKFLIEAGIIQGGQRKQCTELGYKLGRAIQHDVEDEISKGWRQAVKQTDFLQRIISAVRIRKAMEESALLSHIAFTSGNQKTGTSMAGSGAVVEILKLSGLISEDGGTLIATDDTLDEGSELTAQLIQTRREEPNDSGRPSDRDRTLIEKVVQSHNRGPNMFTGLSINLTISCSPSDLDGLGAKLRALAQEFEGVSDVRVDVTKEREAN